MSPSYTAWIQTDMDAILSTTMPEVLLKLSTDDGKTIPCLNKSQMFLCLQLGFLFLEAGTMLCTAPTKCRLLASADKGKQQRTKTK